ncbi:MAG: universal stress protein [candidate division WOR-3 bacterium]
MFKVSKILCPTDFSEPSLYALQFAHDLARQFNAELFVIYVVPTIPLTSTPPPFTAAGIPGSLDFNAYRQTLITEAQKNLDELIKTHLSLELKITPIVEYGEPAERILHVANLFDVDLIVTATHGRTGWRHFIFGSVAEKIIRLSSRPVLTVRKPEAKLS